MIHYLIEPDFSRGSSTAIEMSHRLIRGKKKAAVAALWANPFMWAAGGWHILHILNRHSTCSRTSAMIIEKFSSVAIIARCRGGKRRSSRNRDKEKQPNWISDSGRVKSLARDQDDVGGIFEARMRQPAVSCSVRSTLSTDCRRCKSYHVTRETVDTDQ